MAGVNWLSAVWHTVVGRLATLDPALRSPLAVALGAIPGALCRYYLAQILARWWGTGYPYGTFVANLTGALLMGFFTTYALERSAIPPDVRLLVATGFLGSYTTFSSYMLDTVNLARMGYHVALLYCLGSVVLGVLGIELGSLLARRL